MKVGLAPSHKFPCQLLNFIFVFRYEEINVNAVGSQLYVETLAMSSASLFDSITKGFFPFVNSRFVFPNFKNFVFLKIFLEVDLFLVLLKLQNCSQGFVDDKIHKNPYKFLLP